MRWVVFCLALSAHIFSYLLEPRRLEPFQYFAYAFFWWSYICLLDSIVCFRKGRFQILKPSLPYLILFSSSYWCIFELINLRMENWFYVNVPEGFWKNLPGYFLSYGTVIPGILLTKETLSPLFEEVKTRPLPVFPRLSIGLGFLFLLLLFIFPLYFFPVAWIFLLLITEGYCYLRGFPSFMEQLGRGQAGDVLTTALTGLVCGFLWEVWNTLSVAKWVYSVPFFEGCKLFEMPLPGYLGFVPFALGTVSFANLLTGLRALERPRAVLLLPCILFSIFSFFLIQKYTVFSALTEVGRLSFIEESTRKMLLEQGVRTSYGIDERLLSEEERQRLRLLHLKGMGYERMSLLERHGIDSVEKFSRLDLETLARIWGERNLRRLRVFLTEARKEERWQRRKR